MHRSLDCELVSLRSTRAPLGMTNRGEWRSARDEKVEEGLVLRACFTYFSACYRLWTAVRFSPPKSLPVGRWGMKRLFSFVLLVAVASHAQVTKIMLPAGSPEDKALQAVTAEEDAAKRIAMLQQFLQDYAANPQAVAYRAWEL